MFGTSRETHSLVFTSGATQGIQLLGEHYPFLHQGGCFLYAEESHTSGLGLRELAFSWAQGVLGLRQFARQAKWALGSFALEDLASLSKDLSVFWRQS